MGGPARTIASAVTMQQLAANLSNHLERFVVDKTGVVRDRFEGAATIDELEPALKSVLV